MPSSLPRTGTSLYDHNQTLVPDSFVALFSGHGRATVPLAELEARHETAENLALHIAELFIARQLAPDDSADALGRCLDGLLTASAAASRAEAVWTVCRVAEMLEWPLPDSIAVEAARKPAG
jgi:hypothetical protein